MTGDVVEAAQGRQIAHAAASDLTRRRPNRDRDGRRAWPALPVAGIVEAGCLADRSDSHAEATDNDRAIGSQPSGERFPRGSRLLDLRPAVQSRPISNGLADSTFVLLT